MGKIYFVTHDGKSHEAAIIEGLSLMQIATSNTVPGIDGDCGGCSACGTCHVIVDAAWAAQLGPRNSEEEQMLSMTPECQPHSRLACQIRATKELDGLRVQVPEHQF